MVWGRAILAATTNKKMNARARTMAPAKQSTAATFRNIQRPYHATGENRRIVTKNHKTPECSNGYRQKTLGNCLHLRPNSRQHSALRGCAHTVAHGRAHLAAHGRAHKPRRTSRHHKHRRPILYSLYFQTRINFLFFTLARCNQFFIINNDKVQLILYCYYQEFKLINNKNNKLENNKNKQ